MRTQNSPKKPDIPSDTSSFLTADHFRICAHIDTDALCENLENIRKKIGESVKIIAVVKADAYGHGAIPSARALSKSGLVSCFATATAREGAELRDAGLKEDILVLGRVFLPEIRGAIERGLIFTVFSEEEARELSSQAEALGRTARAQLKTDTGMGRLGLLTDEEGLLEAKRILRLPGLSFEGIFSHFASADERDKSFALSQAESFESFVQRLEEEGFKFKTKHICNSAGVLDLTDEGGLDFRYDAVRCGIMLYGVYPSDEVEKTVALKPVLRLTSRLSSVKRVKAGFCVGYGSTYKTQRESVLGVVSAGYADGYPRSLSNRGSVLICGKRAPIVGRVCMDQFTVDLSGIEQAACGDEVVLIGRQGEDEISAEELAAAAERSSYELLCCIGKRVPRVYSGKFL